MLSKVLKDPNFKTLQDIFSINKEKLLILNDQIKNIESYSDNDDIGNISILFNSKQYNLKDIEVRKVKSDHKKYDSYFNYVKDEHTFNINMKKILFNKPCFKHIDGNKCNNDHIEYDYNLDIGEDFDPKLDEDLIKEEEGLESIENNNEVLQDTNKNEDVDTKNDENFYVLTRKFYLVNALSESPMKIMKKYLEFKEYLAYSKDKLRDFLLNEYYNTTKNIKDILYTDIEKINMLEEENEKQALFSKIMNTLFSIFYFPVKNIEL